MASATPALAESCDGSGWIDDCAVSTDGSQVVIDASLTIPGRDTDATDPVTEVPHRGPSHAAPAPPAPPAEDCGIVGCRGNYEVVTPPDVTLADLASFRPETPALTGEPAGFGIAGLPANIIATASELRVPATILGWDVVVRFVPAGFVFDYGDGATTRIATGGATWTRLGQAQFTPTATSHVYRTRGTYRVGLTVQYAASVDFGTGWRPVPGWVTAMAAGYDVQILEARTALVDRTCLESPVGPGC